MYKLDELFTGYFFTEASQPQIFTILYALKKLKTIPSMFIEKKPLILLTGTMYKKFLL